MFEPGPLSLFLPDGGLSDGVAKSGFAFVSFSMTRSAIAAIDDWDSVLESFASPLLGGIPSCVFPESPLSDIFTWDCLILGLNYFW